MTIDKGVEPPSTTSPTVFPTGGEVSENEAWNMLKNLFMDSFHESVLKQALNAGKINGKYNVEICTNWLLDQQTKIVTPVSTATSRPSTTVSDAVGQRTIPVTTKATDPVRKAETVNIGAINENDLQKAIQNSLREQGPAGLGGQISAEEQELSKIIEASLAANKTRDLRQSTLFFTDPPNPHERERHSVLPVGLKNVGNTCWFSVVVQALFHLPSFRHWIYDINLTDILPSPEAQASSSSQTVLPKELEFMFELRRLFALLLASKRKYVDPSNVVEVLRKQESLQLRNGGVDNQQDVSEFTHLVLEWIEEAFNIVCRNRIRQKEKDQNANTPNVVHEVELSPSPNPIQQLFYGSFLIESRCAGGSSVKEDRFSQYPLHVTDFDSLHDSFESSMSQIEFDESLKTTTSIEHWLTAAPPIFLFELSRFRYNQCDNKPEKIHSKFVFPQTLYIDRYLDKNKSIVRQKRNKVRHLRHNLKLLQAQLNKYEEYGSSVDTTKIPLANVLQYALRFSTASSNAENEEVDVNMESPRSSREELNQSLETATDAGDMEVEDPSAKSVLPNKGDDNFVAELTFSVEEPRPKNITDEELDTLQRCLRRWTVEVNEQVQELKRKINEIQDAINSAYDEPSLKKCTYVLHAVLVHEGQATLGHYWTFVADHKTQTWKKFNDVQVTDVEWNELERDCYGGYQNTSAYCLMYVDADSVDLINGTSFLTNVESLLDLLPSDLKSYVSLDNATFLAEISNWDQRHLHQVALQTPTTAGAVRAATPGAAPVTSSSGEKTAAKPFVTEALAENYEISKRHGAEFAQRYATLRNSPDPPTLALVLKSEIESLNSLWCHFVSSKNLLMDPRLSGVANYAVAWLSPSRCDTVVGYIILEMLLHVSNDDTLRAEVQQLLTGAYCLSESDTVTYNEIHREFQLFSRTVLLVTFAIDFFHEKQRYMDALQYLLIADEYNTKLLGLPKIHVSRAVQLNFMTTFKRMITAKCSADLFDSVLGAKTDDDVTKLMQSFYTLILPTINTMAQDGGDSLTTAKEISELWISLVNNETRTKFGLEVEKRLHDLAEALGSIGTLKTNKPGIVAKFKVTNDLSQRYIKAMKLVDQSGVMTSLL